MEGVADRRNKTIRDMTLSMGVIVVAVLLLVGFDGGFSVSPGKPSGGTAPRANVLGGFAGSNDQTGFTALRPVGLPASWQGSSFSFTAAPGTPQAPPAVRGGWQTPSGSYLTLIESSGAFATVLKVELGQTYGSAGGSVTVGAATWAISPGVRTEVAWSRTVDGLTLLITGSAPESEFKILAAALK